MKLMRENKCQVFISLFIFDDVIGIFKFRNYKDWFVDDKRFNVPGVNSIKIKNI